MAGYPDYYQRAIDENTLGIKLVLGPTGLGKSSSIPDVVHNNPDRKFIYMADRKQLLDEMAARFQSNECVVLRRDLEIVQQVLATQWTAFEGLLADQRFSTALKQARQKSHLKSLDLVTIRRACKQITEMTMNDRALPAWVTEQADTQARIVLQAVRWVLQITRDAKNQSKVYNWLIKHPIVEALFPAIPFHLRSEVRIMLVTLQKAYYGFFDGSQMRSFTNLFEDLHPIVFLDEFDFLENDLVKLICRAPQITDPFDFVANFYRAMANHKLPREDFPLHPNIRKRIEKIVEIINGENGIQKKGLAYPTINQFTLDKTSAQQQKQTTTPAIFRTQHVIQTNPLYINQTRRSFQIEFQQSRREWIPATWFFNAIGTATTRILALFKELEREDDVRYWEMMRQCFRNTDFFDQVATVAQLPRQHSIQQTARGDLLSAGYNVFDIDDLDQRTDNEEIEIRFYQMLQTPENLLCSLAQSSLIFGLSATADLPRCVHHFDLSWIENQGLLLPTTDQDRADIHDLNEEKAHRRGSRMRVSQIDSLNTDDPFHKQLQHFLEAVAHNDEFEDDSGGYRSQRMHRFFAALLWLFAYGGNKPRQLLFFNSFRQIKLLLTVFASHAREAGVFIAEPHPHTPWFDAFTLTVGTQSAKVVFFNAELATQVRLNKEAERAFTTLFWADDPVVVVTQYLSAGNGVNLQYTNEEYGPLQDFTHIGLLEKPYYFFTKPDPFDMSLDEVFAGHKENIWYQAKLFFAKLTSQTRFRQVLSTINRPGEWNQRYPQGSTARDCLLNQLAIFIQALGRIERSWEQTAEQVALFSPEVFRAFQAFMGDDYETIREARTPFVSANLQAVLEDVSAQTTRFEREARRRKDTHLRAKNNQCQEAIHTLVQRLETVRSQGKDLEARLDWEKLRQAVLRHDFHAEVVARYHCVTSSPYYSRGKLNLTQEMDILPLEVSLPDNHIVQLSAVYATIADNHAINEYFLDKGYDLQFDHLASHFFLPYCLQAILAGAIGEEAITAILEKEGVPLEALPNELFEVTDMRISGKPWFIDCKNYNDQTLDRFALPIDDPLWHPTLNEPYFARHAQEKLERITALNGSESKIIYINLVSGQERPLGYYNRDFVRVFSFEEAAIIVVQGALDRQIPNNFHAAFATFLSDMKKALHPPVQENE